MSRALLLRLSLGGGRMSTLSWVCARAAPAVKLGPKLTSGLAHRHTRRHYDKRGAGMRRFDRIYLIWALCYAVAGMALGIYMGASRNHAQFVTHAHVMLVGFVTSLIYAVIYRLWVTAPSRALATIQLVLHQAGSLAMFAGLLLLYGHIASEDQMGPLMGPATIAVTAGVLLMLVMVLKAEARPDQRGDAVEGRRTATN
jgi:hypothetical protein